MTQSELEMSLKQMKNKKCPREDEIITEILKIAGSELWKAIRTLHRRTQDTQTMTKKRENLSH